MASKAWYQQNFRGKRYGYRSGLEEKISKQLEGEGIEPEYETHKLPYKVEKMCKYTPDFMPTSNIVIETKGYFLPKDRVKHLLLKEQYPEIDFRFVFTNANSKLNKTSKTTYGAWCEKNGFKYAEKTIPKEWIKEIKRKENNNVEMVN